MQDESKSVAGIPVNPVLDLIRREIDRRQPGSVDEANRIAAEVSAGYNHTPQSELGGISPALAHHLTRPGWMDAALVLNDRLSLQELEDAPLFQNARRLLLAVREVEVVKATATGAFNRKFTQRMFDEFAGPARSREMFLRLNKVINQNDVPFLALFRHLLPQAGLLLFRKGEFRLTKRANSLIADIGAGELYGLLFRTLFLRLNLAVRDRLPEAPQLQHTIGFAFYQIGLWSDRWIELADAAATLFLPAILESLPSLSWSRDSSVQFADMRILRSLNDFGLIEYQENESWSSPKRVRKTSLFDRFIGFNLSPKGL